MLKITPALYEMLKVWRMENADRSHLRLDGIVGFGKSPSITRVPVSARRVHSFIKRPKLVLLHWFLQGDS